ncbi:hypothetical protein ACVW00_003118 [Marmoricola sp. URHA0025 HA25]
MNYLYGRAWHEQGRFPVGEISEDEARKVWDNGPQLGVAAGESLERGSAPEYSLEMSAHAADVDVNHYDESGSVVASLGWQTIDGRLYLSDVAEWLYPDDGSFHEMDECLAVRKYLFKPDGYARLRSDVKAAGGVTVEEFTGVDVSDHWLEPLAWGDWDRIGRHRPTAAPAS